MVSVTNVKGRGFYMQLEKVKESIRNCLQGHDKLRDWCSRSARSVCCVVLRMPLQNVSAEVLGLDERLGIEEIVAACRNLPAHMSREARLGGVDETKNVRDNWLGK